MPRVPRLTHWSNGGVDVTKICVGPLENNAYLLVCRATGATVIVDAADEPATLLDALDGRPLVAVLTTHGHWDHVQAAAAVSQATGAPVLISPADLDLAAVPGAVPLVGGTVTFGEASLRVLVTPGHTPGSTCFALEGAVLAGDTLFPGGPGATSDADRFAEILHSIETSLFTLDGGTLVFPGHGLDTTIGTERPHLEEWRARGW